MPSRAALLAGDLRLGSLDPKNEGLNRRRVANTFAEATRTLSERRSSRDGPTKRRDGGNVVCGVGGLRVRGVQSARSVRL